MGVVQRYQNRISGPLMDRVDIHLEVARVPFQKLAALEGGEGSASMRGRVAAARQRQHSRFAPLQKPHVLINGDMGPSEVQPDVAETTRRRWQLGTGTPLSERWN